MKNSYSKIGFITAHVYWSIIIWIWYKNLIFIANAKIKKTLTQRE